MDTSVIVGRLSARSRLGLRIAAVAAAAAIVSAGAPIAAHAATYGVVEDANFAACINAKLGHGATDSITATDAASLTGTLSCTSMGIVDLEGAEHLTGLMALNLSSNNIVDASELGALNQLGSLRLDYNQDLSSINFAATMSNLWALQLNSSPAIGNNIGALSGLPLTNLTLNNIGLGDLSPIASITTLEYLSVNANEITDVSPLAGLSNLTNLIIPSNEIKDFSSLQGLPLTNFYAVNQWITDAPTAYVPVGATSYTQSATHAGLIDRSATAAEIIAPSTYSDTYSVSGTTMTFTGIDPAATRLVAAFNQVNATENFGGHVAYPLVWADFTSATPKPGAIDARYSHQFTVTDGFPVTSFTLASGSVPGLTLSSTGELSGIPDTKGTHQITIMAEDANGNVISRELVIEVSAALTLPASGSDIAPVLWSALVLIALGTAVTVARARLATTQRASRA